MVAVLHFVHCDTLSENATDIISKSSSYFIMKYNKSFYKLRQFFITKCASFIRNTSFIKKCNNFVTKRDNSLPIALLQTLKSLGKSA